MVKKGNPTKVLKNLDAGFSIREVRTIDSRTNKLTGSYITIFQGKRQLPDLKFKNTQEALNYFENEHNN